MHRRSFITSAMSVLAVPALAGETAGNAVTVQLNASQIEQLLSDNTIVGTWSGSGYKQYFGTGGFTMYVPDGGQADQGKWRTNGDTNQYESWWRMTGWTPYTVVMTNNGYAWINDEKLEPFDVYEGKQVSW